MLRSRGVLPHLCLAFLTSSVSLVGLLASVPTAGAQDLRARIDSLTRAAGAEVAVAYRTLDGRDELLVRADADFHAASTMKVPVMIELFRQVDAGKVTLDASLPVSNAFKSIVDGSPYSLEVTDDSDEGAIYRSIGKTLTLRELCVAMITVSSNLATNLLIEKLGVENIQRTVKALGADGMRVRRGVEDSKAFQQGLNNVTTARGLLVLLDAIASGKAASPASTREMIDILQQQKFNDAIPAGLPPGTAVAHKTGTITRIQHDAGIVYATRPYVLIVLVRGIQDEKKGHALIADISRQIFAQAQAAPAKPTAVKSRE